MHYPKHLVSNTLSLSSNGPSNLVNRGPGKPHFHEQLCCETFPNSCTAQFDVKPSDDIFGWSHIAPPFNFLSDWTSSVASSLNQLNLISQLLKTPSGGMLQVLRTILDEGELLPAPDAVLINGYGPFSNTFDVEQGEPQTHQNTVQRRHVFENFVNHISNLSKESSDTASRRNKAERRRKVFLFQ